MRQRDGDDAPGAWLKHKMLGLDPAFDERNYGCKSFKEFLGRLAETVAAQTSDGPGDLRVRLVVSSRRTSNVPTSASSARSNPLLRLAWVCPLAVAALTRLFRVA
jgi:hypothetical protein